MGDKPALRVVSLLPSATEILAAIGAADLLVGRSHECDHPEAVRSAPVLTGRRTAPAASAEIDRQVREAADGAEASLYTLDERLLESLRPDVILTQDLCAVCSIDLGTVRRLAARLDPEPAIVSLDPKSIEDVFDDVLRVGQAVGRPRAAAETLVDLRERYWTAVDYVNPYAHGAEIAFLEWIDPVFVGGHWTPQLIAAAGGTHSLNPPGAKSRRVEPDELVASQPERLIVCPCGYDLDAIEREIDTLRGADWWTELPAVRHDRVVAVDGNAMFNRPGPRLVEAFRWLVGWINDRPEPMPAAFPARRVAPPAPSEAAGRSA